MNLSLNYREESGFTLLELIVSFTILTIIVALMFETMNIGIKAWETGGARVEFLYRMKYLFDLMEKEISSIQPYYFLEENKDTKQKNRILAFEGQKNSIRFVSSSPGYNPSLSPGGLREVTFLIGNEEKGLIMTERIIQSGQPFMTKDSAEERTVLLSTDVSDIEFRYYKLKGTLGTQSTYDGEWLESFPPYRGTSDTTNLQDDTNLPRAVEVTLSMKKLKGEINKTIETFYLPPSIILLKAGIELRLIKKENL